MAARGRIGAVHGVEEGDRRSGLDCNGISPLDRFLNEARQDIAVEPKEGRHDPVEQRASRTEGMKRRQIAGRAVPRRSLHKAVPLGGELPVEISLLEIAQMAITDADRFHRMAARRQRLADEMHAGLARCRKERMGGEEENVHSVVRYRIVMEHLAAEDFELFREERVEPRSCQWLLGSPELQSRANLLADVLTLLEVHNAILSSPL